MKKIFILIIIAVTLVSGCKRKDKEILWGVYQEPVKPQSLPADSGLEELKVLWRKNIGNGASDGYAKLKPAYFEESIFAA